MNKHARALGKIGGKAKTLAKATASRENGKLGGRPNKLRRLLEQYRQERFELSGIVRTPEQESRQIELQKLIHTISEQLDLGVPPIAH